MFYETFFNEFISLFLIFDISKIKSKYKWLLRFDTNIMFHEFFSINLFIYFIFDISRMKLNGHCMLMYILVSSLKYRSK